ncbi:hypothetical protein M885DRAFT_575436 [Pelagophyceae sp. CCMP2097]|nr:hypothetical protein M885DRAFT_575436 [Pelagophyceae sp. CCMP2097]
MLRAVLLLASARLCAGEAHTLFTGVWQQEHAVVTRFGKFRQFMTIELDVEPDGGFRGFHAWSQQNGSLIGNDVEGMLVANQTELIIGTIDLNRKRGVFVELVESGSAILVYDDEAEQLGVFFTQPAPGSVAFAVYLDKVSDETNYPFPAWDEIDPKISL